MKNFISNILVCVIGNSNLADINENMLSFRVTEH